MGGIAAVFGDLPVEVGVQRVRMMVARSPHRGQATFVTGAGCAVAVQSNAGDGSVWQDEERIVAVHGYVGNRRELPRGPAGGHEGETPLARWLAEAYGQFGERVFGLLRGEFAVLIYDITTRSVALVRDVPGLRPLHLATDDVALYVGSEVRQVLAGLGVAPRLDDGRLAYWLAGVQAPSGRTFFTGVREVLPGRLHHWEVGREPVCRRSDAYWEPPTASLDERRDFKEIAEDLRDHMTRAVARSLPEAPFAVAVSGGLDSSGVWALLTLLHREGDPRAGLGRAFSLGFPGMSCDETEFIRLVHAVGSGGAILDGRSVRFSEGLASLLKCVDYPAMPTLLHLALVTQTAVADGRRVLLLGSGGNEWLSGNLVYLEEELRAGHVLTVVADLLRLQLPAGLSRRNLTARTLRGVTRAGLRRREPVAPPWLSEQHREEIDRPAGREPARLLGGRRQFRSNRERMLQNLHAHQAGALLGREQYAASLGTELRHPLFDLDLIAYCFMLPGRAFIGGVRSRHLQRTAVADLLPPRVRDRTDQSHLTDLVSDEMRGVVNTLPRRAGGWNLVGRGIVARGGLDNLLDRYYAAQRLSRTLVSIAVAECFVRAVSGD